MDLKKLDLNLLVTFEAIYTAGNISKAAEAMNIRQPTVSNGLTRLREAVGDALFVRKGRGVVPTPRAIAMIGPVREALEKIQSGLGDVDQFDPKVSQRHFRVVILDMLEPTLMPPVIRAVQKHKSITLEMLPVLDFPIADKLSDGSLDLVLSTFDPQLAEIDCEQIGAAKIVVVARKGHPDIQGELTRDNIQNIGHLALVPRLRSLSRIDEALHFAQLDRHIVYSVTKFWSFPQTLATTDLIAFMPGDFAVQAAKFFPLEIYACPFEFPEQKIYMMWKKSKESDPGLSWLRQQIVAAHQENEMSNTYLP